MASVNVNQYITINIGAHIFDMDMVCPFSSYKAGLMSKTWRNGLVYVWKRRRWLRRKEGTGKETVKSEVLAIYNYVL